MVELPFINLYVVPAGIWIILPGSKVTGDSLSN
jgi:hypothetical protein